MPLLTIHGECCQLSKFCFCPMEGCNTIHFDIFNQRTNQQGLIDKKWSSCVREAVFLFRFFVIETSSPMPIPSLLFSLLSPLWRSVFSFLPLPSWSISCTLSRMMIRTQPTIILDNLVLNSIVLFLSCCPLSLHGPLTSKTPIKNSVYFHVDLFYVLFFTIQHNCFCFLSLLREQCILLVSEEHKQLKNVHCDCSWLFLVFVLDIKYNRAYGVNREMTRNYRRNICVAKHDFSFISLLLLDHFVWEGRNMISKYQRIYSFGVIAFIGFCYAILLGCYAPKLPSMLQSIGLSLPTDEN